MPDRAAWYELCFFEIARCAIMAVLLRWSLRGQGAGVGGSSEAAFRFFAGSCLLIPVSSPLPPTPDLRSLPPHYPSIPQASPAEDEVESLDFNGREL